MCHEPGDLTQDLARDLVSGFALPTASFDAWLSVYPRFFISSGAIKFLVGDNLSAFLGYWIKVWNLPVHPTL